MQVVAGDTRLCPACGTRAKEKWDFCPRCGESLANAATAPAQEAVGAPEAVEEAPEGAWKGYVGVVAGLAVAMAAFVVFRRPAPAPAASVFQIPRESAAVAAPKPPPTRPGAEAFQKGRLLLASGDIAGATPLLAEAAGQDPDYALYRYTYGKALWLGKANEDALGELAAATRLNGDSPFYWTELARLEKELGRNSDALRSFERATSLFPDDIDTLKDYGSLLARLDDRQRAVTILKHVAETRPTDAALQQEVGYELETAGDLASAENAYRRVVNLIGDAPIARSRLAEVMFQQNRPQDAVAVLREGLAKTPDRSPLLYRSLGSLLERTGSPAEAAAAYRQYIQRAGGTEDAKDIEQRAVALERRAAAQS